MAKKPAFSVGDLVKLKSGGPNMTVQYLSKQMSTQDFSGSYTCQWFAGKKLDAGKFPEESLEKVEAE